MQKNGEILGALATNGDRAAIFYSDRYKKDSHRCRFTIAHEIAHCCLDQSDDDKKYVHIEYRRCPESEKIREKEEEANIFAGKLLIPEEPLKRLISGLLVPSTTVLEKTFDVSHNVMCERLKYLKIEEKIYGYNA